VSFIAVATLLPLKQHYKVYVLYSALLKVPFSELCRWTNTGSSRMLSSDSVQA